MEYQKIKSVAKQVLVKGPALDKLVLETMRTVASVVGATLGPGGRAVLIERFEHDLPSMVTKDGVTVFRSLGFTDPAAHCVMECARDASVRTASEAGDGTTTATVLAEAIVRLTSEYVKSHPRVSPQKVVRRLESAFRDVVEPALRTASMAVNPTAPIGRHVLHSVAKTSANGEVALADAVMECFDLVGDEGNVQIIEASGKSHYEVERIEGYAVPVGYEESCAKFYPKFVNDPGTQKCLLEKPVFVVYHGRITEIGSVQLLLEKVGAAWPEGYNRNVVLVAVGFSESVLANLAANFAEEHSINVFPLQAPQSPLANGQHQFLMDVCAITGATLFDPLNRPLEGATLNDLGPNLLLRDEQGSVIAHGVAGFEASRFRSMIIGHAEGVRINAEDGSPDGRYEDDLLERVTQIQTLLKNPESQLDRMLLQEQLGKLTGGIAKLKVIGASNGELKEKRDRAEDAVCAVRGAIKHGVLPGGGWGLLYARDALVTSATRQDEEEGVLNKVLMAALYEPFKLLLVNAGYSEQEIGEIGGKLQAGIAGGGRVVYDVAEGKFVDPYEAGVLDSAPAVVEAVRNSISIASLLGTLGGTVVFARDLALERSEARDTQEWARNASVNPADERG